MASQRASSYNPVYMSYQEDGHNHCLKNQLVENLHEVGLSITDVHELKLLSVIPDDDVINFFKTKDIDTPIKMIVISLSENDIPPTQAVALWGEDMYFGIVILDMFSKGYNQDPFLTIASTTHNNEYQVYLDYKQSVGPQVRFTKRADIPLGITQSNEGLLAFFWNPDRDQMVFGSIVMPIGWEEKLKQAGIMNSSGIIAEPYLQYRRGKTEKVKTVRSAGEIREKLEAKYSWILPHYIRFKNPRPDPLTQPEEYQQWERSKKVINCCLELDGCDMGDLDDGDEVNRNEAMSYSGDMESFNLWKILEHLATPVSERLIRMADYQQLTNYVESPTNAKQTAKAIDQIIERFNEVGQPINPYDDAELDNMLGVRAAGWGFRSDGSIHELTPEELEKLDQQIEEAFRTKFVVDTFGQRQELEAKMQYYLDLLPPHIRAKYESETKK